MQIRKEATAVDKADPIATAIARGVSYLLQTLPSWKQPNGEATRALVLAGAKGYDVGASLDATLNIVKQPSAWPRDQHVALGFALAAAERHGRAASTDVTAAAKLLMAEQQADGSFGSVLDTWRARVTLIDSGIQPDEVWVILIDRWVRGLTVESVADAAAVLLALDLAGDVMAENLRRTCLGLLRSAQAPTGGWGPDAKPAIHETTLAVMALAVLDAEPRMARSAYRPEELKAGIQQGKVFLATQQRADGGWPASGSGDPAGISSTGWVLLALLA
jgi:hypothetical protein